MLLIGLIFFLFLLVLLWSGIVWIVGKIGKAKGQEQKYRNYTRALGVFIAIATILFFVADEIYTKKQFEQLCKKEAGLKIYKKVDNVDGFLNIMGDNPKNYQQFAKYYQPFKFYENVEYYTNEELKKHYKIKEYYVKKENNQYKIDYFLIMTNKEYIGKGKYKETIVKENNINFENYKIDRYLMNNDKEYLKEENVRPISRYAVLETIQPLDSKFGVSKMVIFDIQDYSIIVEHLVISNGGGKLITTIGDIFYGGSYVGNCGLEQQKFTSPIDFFKQFFQPTV